MSAEIEQVLIKMIAGHAEVKPETLKASMLVKETGIDSLDIADLMFDLEEHYDIILDDAAELQERFELGTIKDLAKKLEQKLEQELEVEA